MPSDPGCVEGPVVRQHRQGVRYWRPDGGVCLCPGGAAAGAARAEGGSLLGYQPSPAASDQQVRAFPGSFLLAPCKTAAPCRPQRGIRSVWHPFPPMLNSEYCAKVLALLVPGARRPLRREMVLDALSPLGTLGSGIADSKGAIYLWAALPEGERLEQGVVVAYCVCAAQHGNTDEATACTAVQQACAAGPLGLVQRTVTTSPQTRLVCGAGCEDDEAVVAWLVREHKVRLSAFHLPPCCIGEPGVYCRDGRPAHGQWRGFILLAQLDPAAAPGCSSTTAGWPGRAAMLFFFWRGGRGGWLPSGAAVHISSW